MKILRQIKYDVFVYLILSLRYSRKRHWVLFMVEIKHNGAFIKERLGWLQKINFRQQDFIRDSNQICFPPTLNLESWVPNIHKYSHHQIYSQCDRPPIAGMSHVLQWIWTALINFCQQRYLPFTFSSFFGILIFIETCLILNMWTQTLS